MGQFVKAVRGGILLLAGVAISWTSFAQIGPPPVILVQPLPLAVLIGNSASFSVAVLSGTQVKYQWRLNGNAIPGANKSSLTVQNANSANAGNYSVAVQNASGSVVSLNALLSILIPQTPLTFTSSAMTADGFTMTLSGPSGYNYVILASKNLGKWTPIATNAAPYGTVVFTDTTFTKNAVRYYQAMLQ